MHRMVVAAALAALLALGASSASTGAVGFELRSLDGSNNNTAHGAWGKSNTPYLRVAPASYADGVGTMVDGPPARYISNRVFNDIGQNVFSETDVSQWGWLWGQFLDHTFGLRDETPGESAPIPFWSKDKDPLERFQNDLASMDFARTPAAPNTGVTTTRQQINTVPSYIDAFAVYGGTATRLAWLRNRASMFLPRRYLPRARDKANAPPMDLMGPLQGNPSAAVVAGDVRANENIGLTAVHTLFAREHNRIVAELPTTLSDEDRFQIARRIVGAEEQYITYREFLPSLGVQLAPWHGYDASVDATLSNEFATVGYRAHSQIHGEMEPAAPLDRWTPAQLDSFRRQGILVAQEGGEIHLTIPLGITFGNPDLLPAVGVGPLLRGLGDERQYKNDEQIDDSLRSILFELPKPGVDPSVCGEPVVNPSCYSLVQDLGAIDVQRGRDHGMPSYNAMRVAYGLAPKTSFASITGDSTDAFPAGMGVNDPASLVFTSLVDDHGNTIAPGSPAAQNEAVSATRASTLAARLKAVYGSVDKIDAFVGMVSEPHVAGTEFGELQLAMWKKQFEALRDGDRFFYANDPALDSIRATYGIDYRMSLADVIEANTGVEVQPNVFKAPDEDDAPDPVPNLVAAYGFDEGAGTAVADASGHGNDGAALNTGWTSGRFGNALSFNGSSSSVRIADDGSLDLTTRMTLEAWVKPAALGTTWRTVIFKQQPNGMEYSLYANDASSRPVTQVQIAGEQNTEGAATLPVDAWTHLASTYDGTTVRLYVNGDLAASQPQSGSIGVSGGVLRIGGNAVWPEWFKGAIDEVRLYDRALSQAEIRADLATPVAGTVPAALPPVLAGAQQVQPDANPEPAGTAEAFPSTAGASGTARRIVFYVDGDSTAASLFAGLYTDDGGHPGTLLTEGAVDPVIAGVWNTVSFPPTALAAGTTYWIAILAPDGQLVFRDRCCTVAGRGNTETEAHTGLDGLPRIWTTGTVYDDAPMSAYATG